MKERECTQCDLCLINNMKLTWGVGNPNAKIMFIGGTPTAAEVKTGDLFIGKSHELLQKMLYLHNFNRSNSYFTYIVKCRTPKHRHPTDIEVAKCMPYLIRELQEVNPTIIVLIGETALKHFYGSKQKFIQIEHGRYRLINKTVVISVLPAAGIYATDAHLPMLLDDYKTVAYLYKVLYRSHTLNY